MTAKEILGKLISFNTVADKENGPIMDWIADFLRGLDFGVKFTFGQDGKKSFLASAGHDTVLTFSCHTDTVPAGNAWTFPPFQLTEKEGKLYGLGACDAKGGLAAILAAVSQFDWSKAKKGVNILISYDEEVDWKGIKNFTEKERLSTKYVIVAEPTGLSPVIASKGVAGFKVQFQGLSAHSSEPGKGRNAILAAQEFTTRLLAFFEKIKVRENPIFTPPTATINISRIQGGDAINRVPENCLLEFECRTIDRSQAEEIYNGILEILEDFEARLDIEPPVPPIMSHKESFSQEISRLTGKKPIGLNYATEGSFLTDHEVVILGPGPMVLHIPDEYILEESFQETIEVYKKIINEYCFGHGADERGFKK